MTSVSGVSPCPLDVASVSTVACVQECHTQRVMLTADLMVYQAGFGGWYRTS